MTRNTHVPPQFHAALNEALTRPGQTSWPPSSWYSTLTGYGVFDARMVSARDPEYTVVPQRERLAKGLEDHSPSVTG